MFLPAVRPLLALAAELEDERNHVIPPPSGDDATLLDVEVPEPVEGEPDGYELVDADASFAHVLHAGRAVVAAPDLTDDDEDFLGLPGILSPEQMAQLLARRDEHARKRASSMDAAPARHESGEAASWRAGAQLRREVNRLVGVVAARQGSPHGQVHALLRRAVPGPASAAASVEVLEQRRDHLLGMLGGTGA